MTDLYAALGRSQLKRLDDFIDRRQVVSRHYTRLITEDVGRGLIQDPKAESSWHLFVVLVEKSHERKIIFDGLRQEGVLVNVHYRPIYRQSFYANMNKYNPSDFPGAEHYYSSAISLPIFPGLEERDVEKIVHLLSARAGYQGIF